ncbi:ABC transporter permease subunit [Mycoplasma elephantis]|uniref:ABC transporter permease subunit n=1 Tax=Mycoplasma elephantis TaxID=114882 RepID=UPI000486FC39|nr:hypothetical protein [Mycoplasma elephantis]
MSQINNFETLKEKNLIKRKQEELKKTKKDALREIKQELLIEKNTFLTETNNKLRKVKMLKKENKINKKYNILEAKLKLKKELSSVSGVTPYINFHKTLDVILKDDLNFLKNNKELFSNAYGLDKMYPLQNKLLTKKSQLRYLNKVKDNLNDEELKSIPVLEHDITIINDKYNKLLEQKTKEYEDIYYKNVDRINELIDKNLREIQNVQIKYGQKNKPQDIYNEKISAINNRAELRYQKLKAKYEKKISEIQANTEKKIKNIEYKRDIYAISSEKANKLIDEISINSVQLQRKWNNLLANLKKMDFNAIYDLKHEKLELNKKKENDDLNARKQIIMPIKPLKKLKVAIDDLYANHLFGNSISFYLKRFSSNFRKFSMFYIMVILLLVFGFLSDFSVLKPVQIINNFKYNSFVFIISMGMLLVIIAGYIDLSAGVAYGMVAYLTIKINNEYLQDLPGKDVFVLLCSLSIGALIGIFNGFIIGYLKIPAFVTTLGTTLIINGLMLLISSGLPSNLSNEDSLRFLQKKIPDVNIGTKSEPFFLFIFLAFILFSIFAAILCIVSRRKAEKYNLLVDKPLTFTIKTLFISLVIIVFGLIFARNTNGTRWFIVFIFVAIIIMFIITKNTSFGRKVYAIGGNRVAAQLSGINPKRTTFYIYLTIGLMMGLAGFTYAGSQGVIPASTGIGQELDVIAAVYVGGASASGGTGNVIGTIIGGFIMSVINNSLNLLQVSNAYQYIIKGIILISAVGIDVFNNRKIG